ncbi:MAG: beta-ketoacyl-[acyl-carrier-protein] synthase family protein [Bacteroidales bacterium]|nr:beta-ketoacyl-[acyl-carrier-protein] synthase family protein [Bacteroidales bacterium]
MELSIAKMTDILITGAGIVSAIGVGKDETLRSLLEERSGIRPLKYLNTTRREFPVGEVQLSNDEMCTLLGIDSNSQPTTRTALMGMLALKEALEQARLSPDLYQHIPLISGTTVGGMDKSEQYYLDFLEGDSRNEYIRTHDCGACTEMIADHFGRFQLLTTLSTACSSAANAVITGAELIRAGRADCVVVGGSECITKFHLNGFASLMILDRESCRPFDASRAGLNLGEGAAWLVLESSDHAQKRGAEPLAHLAGYGNACDAFHQTATSADGEGPYRAMKLALESVGITPNQVDYINTHGTGTVNNDLTECAALSRLFGEQVPPFSSTKAFTGHTTSASGTIEAVICLLAMQHSFLPVNLRFTNADSCQKPVSTATAKPLRYVLSNAFGFGGNDSALLFAQSSAEPVPAPKLITAEPISAQRPKVYLLSAAQISAQQPLCDDWIEHPEPLTEPLTRSREADYKQFIPPLEARRMGRIIKRAIATAKTAIDTAGIGIPEAIITGTGLGCIENTEIFLDALCREGEDQMMPTRFMSSTHNTMSSLVAINLQDHGYNVTYAHNTVSFQSALMDALLQLRRGAIGNAMVCAHDEMTPSYHALLCKGGFLAGKKATECSVSMVLASDNPGNALCEVAGMRMLYRPTEDERQQALDGLLKEADVTDYHLTDGYPDLFGTCYTSPALDLYAAAHLIKDKPLVVRYSDEKHYSLILLRPCSAC